MARSIVERFINALREVEELAEMKGMLSLFTEDCEISNVAIHPLHGKQGVLQFWQDYRGMFEEVHTKFTSVTEADEKAFLEWTSRGLLKSERSLAYEGLTVLECQNDAIVRFKAYHDSAAFLKEGGKHEEALVLEPGDRPIFTSEVMEGGPRRDISTPGEGVLTSTSRDRDTSTD